MKPSFGRLSGKTAAFFSMLFSGIKKQTDHRKLAQHILSFSRKHTLADIISETALCFKEVLDYRLFAFVLKQAGGADVWLDPRIYKDSIEKRIMADFRLKHPSELNYLNHRFYGDEPVLTVNMKDLVYYESTEENIFFRVYLIPWDSFSSYHDDVVNLILQGCSAAMVRQMRFEDLENAAALDPLTGCYNRREFENQLKKHVAGAARHRTRLSVFMFDLDHFKSVNDTYGHLAGDAVLREIASLVRDNMRSGDTLARYGGEEFIAILPETDKTKAMELADRLRVRISQKKILFGGHSLSVTASFGVSEMNPKAGMAEIVQEADAMLYKAKLNGRNTVMPGIFKVIQDQEPGQLKREGR